MIDVPCNGNKHLQHSITLFYPSPSANNENAEQEHTRAVRDAVVSALNSNTALVGAYFDDESNLKNRLNAQLFRFNY